MTNARFPLHTITTEDLPHALQPLQALIIDTESTGALQTALQQLYTHNSLNIGYLSCSESALGAIVELCIEANVVAIVTGTPYFYSSKEAFSATLVDAAVNNENDLCRKITNHPDVDLFSVIGCQLYLSDPKSLEELAHRYFETLRLGALRDNMNTAEPLLRESQQVYFNMNAVRSSDAPECTLRRPNGMYAEEICQIARYTGCGSNLYYVNISGYLYDLEHFSQTTQLVAQLIWHLISGMAARNAENILFHEQNPDFKKIIVNMDDHQQLFFINSINSHRWWMKIPLKNNTSRWIPCLYEDYQCACRHEVPSRWIWFYQMLSIKQNVNI